MTASMAVATKASSATDEHQACGTVHEIGDDAADQLAVVVGAVIVFLFQTVHEETHSGRTSYFRALKRSGFRGLKPPGSWT